MIKREVLVREVAREVLVREVTRAIAGTPTQATIQTIAQAVIDRLEELGIVGGYVPIEGETLQAIEAPDVVGALTKWLDANVMKCSHGYALIGCGLCMADQLRR